MKQQRVDEAENGRIRSDAKRQRQHRDGHKSRRPCEYAQAVTQILQENFEKVNAACIPALFLNLICSAEFQACSAHGFFARQTGANVLLHLLLEVKLQFLVELAFHCASFEK